MPDVLVRDLSDRALELLKDQARSAAGPFKPSSSIFWSKRHKPATLLRHSRSRTRSVMS